MRVITNAMLQTSVFDIWCGLSLCGTLFVWASILTAFRYSLRVLKINNSRYVYYRFSILAVNNGMQRLFGRQYCVRVNSISGLTPIEVLPFGSQNRLEVKPVWGFAVWESTLFEDPKLPFRGHFGSHFWGFFS